MLVKAHTWQTTSWPEDFREEASSFCDARRFSLLFLIRSWDRASSTQRCNSSQRTSSKSTVEHKLKLFSCYSAMCSLIVFAILMLHVFRTFMFNMLCLCWLTFKNGVFIQKLSSASNCRVRLEKHHISIWNRWRALHCRLGNFTCDRTSIFVKRGEFRYMISILIQESMAIFGV